MNFFGNNCGGDFEHGPGFGGGCCIDPCLLLILMLCGGNRGCGCNIDCCSLLWIMILLSVCGGNNCGGGYDHNCHDECR